MRCCRVSAQKRDAAQKQGPFPSSVACGKNAGIDTVFVLSGEGIEADREKYGVQPTWTLTNIRAVLEELG